MRQQDKVGHPVKPVIARLAVTKPIVPLAACFYGLRADMFHRDGWVIIDSRPIRKRKVQPEK